MKVFEVIGILTVLLAIIFFGYVNLVSGPDCQRQGYAWVDVKGCWIIKDGVRTYGL